MLSELMIIWLDNKNDWRSDMPSYTDDLGRVYKGSKPEVVVAVIKNHIKSYDKTKVIGSLKNFLESDFMFGVNLNLPEYRPDIKNSFPPKKDTWLFYLLNNGWDRNIYFALLEGHGGFNLDATDCYGYTFLERYLERDCSNLGKTIISYALRRMRYKVSEESIGTVKVYRNPGDKRIEVNQLLKEHNAKCEKDINKDIIEGALLLSSLKNVKRHKPN